MDWSEFGNWEEHAQLLVGLLAVTNPLGVIPLLGSMAAKFSPAEKRRTIHASVSTYAITLIIALFIGTTILGLFGITLAAFRIAGGVMFLFYALEMLGLIQIPASSASDDSTAQSSKTIGVTPVGIPLLAGPGAISTIILYGSLHDSFAHKILVVAVILTIAVVVYLLFRATLLTGRGLGKTGAAIMNKIMGLLLAAIAIEFVLDGLIAHFPQLIGAH